MKSLEKNLMMDNVFSGSLIVLAISWAVTAGVSGFLADHGSDNRAVGAYTHTASTNASPAGGGQPPSGHRA